MEKRSVVQMFFDVCEEYQKPDAVMVREDGSYKPYSHNFFKQRVSHFSRGLLHLGLQEDERVAILAETRFEWAIADLGILGAGGVVVPVYPTLLPDDIAYILNHSESSMVVVSSAEQAVKVLSIKDQLPQLKHVMVMNSNDGMDGVSTMNDIEMEGVRQDNEALFIQRRDGRDRDHLVSIIYTSGTTGRPKGVMLTHGNILSNIKSVEPYMVYGPEDVALSHLPLSHVLERTCGYYCLLYRGVTIAYAESIATVRDNIKEVRPTILVSVPRLYEKIYAGIMVKAQAGNFLKRKLFNWALGVGRKAIPYFNTGRELPGMLAKQWGVADKMVFSKIKEATGGRLRFMSSGGAPLAKEVAELFIGMKLILIEGYGLTETAPILTTNRPDWNKPGTVGMPIDGVEIRIADDGEILARGPNVMQGYYKNKDATDGVIIDGWFHTGDIGVMDNDQFLRITDRKKDLVVTSGGKNIAPQPMENALKLCPLIEQAVIIGDQRNFISALIVPPWETVTDWAAAKGWPTNPMELSAHGPFLDFLENEIAMRMNGFAHYEKVKKFRVIPQLFTTETGELTPSMKVKRKVVNDKFKSVIDDMYAAPKEEA